MLDSAQRISPGTPEILNDLAVMHLELAEREQQLEPMLEALDLVERAIERDSTLLPALFNRALILDRLYLVNGAKRAWQQYLGQERNEAWRLEAEQHARQAGLRLDTLSWPEILKGAAHGNDSLGTAVLVRHVKLSPQAAREFCFRTLLGDWGLAVQRGSQAEAAGLLSLAHGLAGAFDALGIDLSLPLALRTIDGSRQDPARLRRMAIAHSDLASGLSFFFADAFDHALPLLDRAERSLRSLGSPAARWAGLYMAGAKLSTGDYNGADRVYDRVLSEATANEPALVGKATAALGVSQLRRGNYESAYRHYRAAVPHFRRAQEPENEAYISYLITEALNLTGQSAAGHSEAYQGLRLLSPYRRSNYLNNHLTTVAAYARAGGLDHAALAVMDEVLDVAQALEKPSVHAWALRARARDLIALGRSAAAHEDLMAALSISDLIPSGHTRDRVRADVNLVLAQLTASVRPGESLPVFSDVTEVYRKLNLPRHVPIALYQAALAAERAGNRDFARAHLEETIRHIEAQQAAFAVAELRSSLSETVEDVYDAMIGIELDDGRPRSALEYLERGRLAGWAPGAGSTATLQAPSIAESIASLTAMLTEGTLLVDYAVLPTRLAIWTATRTGVRNYIVDIPRDSLAGLVRHFNIELRSARAATRGEETRLYEVLLGPISEELGKAHQLIVIPDRELQRVPFAALRDPASERYVIEDYQVRTLPSIAFFAAATVRARTHSGVSGAVVVGDPTLVGSASEHLPALPGAAREARTIADLYPHATLLTSGEATRQRVIEILPSAKVFHFAGHAVFNSERPELSYLALAGGGSDDGLLSAREIGTLRLSNLDVVVLSACSTLNPRLSRTGAVAGLAYSFLRAGAPATISTLWDVVDHTTEQVLVWFHRELSAGTDPAEALRIAQIKALRSERPELLTPWAWGAFIYTGF